MVWYVEVVSSEGVGRKSLMRSDWVFPPPLEIGHIAAKKVSKKVKTEDLLFPTSVSLPNQRKE